MLLKAQEMGRSQSIKKYFFLKKRETDKELMNDHELKQ